MVETAGGTDGLGKPGEPSFAVTWRQVADYQPEGVGLMPCGFHLRETQAEVERTVLPAEWAGLPAVRQGRVFAVDGSSYFNRPGPRLVESLEILAEVMHPAHFSFGHQGVGWVPMG
ncbi:MAG: hypothetical protein IIC64_19605 [SAR324 cluster bacterium]|nr:hypothetical protein [SAR324 cluster bacterium]